VSAPLDKEGFLQNYQDWQPELAPGLAAAEDIELTNAHWEVIHLVRDYYQQYHISPTSRVLAKVVADKLGPDKGKSIYLMKLFTAKSAKLVAKIAGLPKPNNCD
jgi:tRNA 2-thiouridine synthesizing protein E